MRQIIALFDEYQSHENGNQRFNQREAKTGRAKPTGEIVEVAVPAIVEPPVLTGLRDLKSAIPATGCQALSRAGSCSRAWRDLPPKVHPARVESSRLIRPRARG